MFKGMKAATAPADLTKIRMPKMASTKINGVRGLIVDGVVMSYNMKPIPNDFVQEQLGHNLLNGLDGELIVGLPNDHNSLRNTISGVMRHNGPCDVHFHVFDIFLERDKPYTERYRYIQKALSNKLIQCAGHNRLVVVEHRLLNTHEEVLQFEQDTLNMGYEGIMLRAPFGPYKLGRSTPREDWLWKVKRFEDAEAVIVGFEEEMENRNVLQTNELGKAKRTSHKENKFAKGTLGGLLVVGSTGRYKDVPYRVGIGFTDQEAQEIWDNGEAWMGRTIKVKYFPVGNKDKPAHTVYLGERRAGE